MKSQWPSILGGSTVLLTLILGRVIYEDFDRRAADRSAEQQQEITRRQVAWALEDQKLALAVQDRDQRLDTGFSNRLILAFGGPVPAAVKNPKWSIAEMLQQTAVACAPPGTRVTVSVDRFTDFDVALELPDGVSRDQIADIGRILITNTLPYVHSVRFYEAGQSAGHWDAMGDAGVGARETRTKAANAPSLGAAGADANVDSAVDEEMDPNQKKYLTGQEKFNKRFAEHSRQLNKLAVDFNSLASLKSIPTAYKFKAQISWLERLSIQFTNEQTFFLNQDWYWEQSMQEQKLDPLLIGILKRDVVEKTKAALPLYDDLFQALAAYRDQIGHFLKAMDACREQWRLVDQSDVIQFSTSDANSTYTLESGMLQADAESLNAAMQRLSRFIQARPAPPQ
jgi:hypothetical protein